MLITVKATYTQINQGNVIELVLRASYTGVAFDTDALAMTPVTGTWFGGFFDTKIPDPYLAPEGLLLHVVCPTDPTDHTATIYRFKRAGVTFTTETEENSSSCGYNPPEIRSCNLLIPTVTVNYDQATVTCTNFVGPLEYSLDGGNNRQLSNLFPELAAGDYEVTVYDLGASLPGCKKTKEFSVSDQAPPGEVAKVGELPAFCFAGNPVIVSAEAAVAFHHVLVQVYVETAHRSGSFQLAFESKRRSNSQRLVQLDVHDILSAHVHDAGVELSETWTELNRPIRNWFVRVADVLPQNNKPGAWATSNNSVVLAGGLAPEPLAAGADYWNTARQARLFHTWQPFAKQVGPQHLELLQLLVPDTSLYGVRIRSTNQFGEALPGRGLAVPPLPVRPPAANQVAPPPLLDAQKVRFMQLALDVATFPDAVQLVIDVVAGPRVVDIEAGEDSDDPGFSIERTLDVATDAEPRQLIYQNSLAGLDTLALFGKMSGKLALDPATVEAYLPTASAAAARIAKSWPGLPTVPSYALNTGWLSPEWLENLHELVQPGRQVYEYVNGQLRPVVLTTKELPIYQEGGALNSATIDYRPALINEYFTDYARNTNRNADTGAGW